ncbi:NAD(P)-dependent oxidoreductase [Mucilaginibacter jinjuensis]|uniref:NAD(P)-dependent oxidoreductase n=1 Tax=Mucilaginibacter jinjuensis TaxID=1176721 RepID=A0ABY7T3T0_9SPHI|nr:NAD(P)-dependent oxidoreductase [Mucilaginibacter jinjuensis]WCT10840.1 NAD(P)-dependent oxidoreductase [Mucilaginibacter jinjuensis]
MKIALIGATGFVGTNVLREALHRDHTVTAIARNTQKIELENANLTKVALDVLDTDKLVEVLAGNDIVISAYNAGWTNPDLYNDFIKGSQAIQTATKQAGVKRLLVIGGAGSLFIDGQQLVDSPQFPAEWKAGATAARDYLTDLRKEEELDWTFLSPAIELHPGERTGKYRIGTESPVFDENGKCSITAEDMAIAIVDEAENKQFAKQRFTVGY